MFYLAQQLVTYDTGSFQFRLHEHVQSIALSPECSMVIIPYACRDIKDYDAIWHHRVTIRHLVCITADALHAQAPCILCIMCRSLIPVWSLWVSAIHCLTLLIGFLLLQVPTQQPLDRASWWSFECYHPTCRTVSVHRCRGSVWFFPFSLPVIII